MRTKTRATLEDLHKVEGKAELVHGEIVHMPPAGDEPSVTGGEIFANLRDYARHTRRGRAYPDGAGFKVNLPHRESFSPDAPAYISAIALIETVWVLRSTYDANREHIQRVLDILLRSRGVMVERSDLVWMALRASSEGSADFGDYLIEQLGAAAGCDCTVTFDRDASKSARMKLLR